MVCGWFSLCFRSWRRDGGRAISVRQDSQDNLSAKIWNERRPSSTSISFLHKQHQIWMLNMYTIFNVQQAVSWKKSFLKLEDWKWICFFILLFVIFCDTSLGSNQNPVFKPVYKSLLRDKSYRQTFWQKTCFNPSNQRSLLFKLNPGYTVRRAGQRFEPGTNHTVATLQNKTTTTKACYLRSTVLCGNRLSAI